MKRFLTAIVLVLFCTSISLALDNNLKKIVSHIPIHGTFALWIKQQI